MQRKPDKGVNEVIASILMVALVIALVIIIGSIVFGVIVIQPKSAYIPPRVEVVNYSGQQAISLSSRGGAPAVLAKGAGVEYALGIYVENSSMSSRATPDTGVKTFGPGQTLYIYYRNGEYRVTDNLTGKIFDQLPPGPLTLRLVDENARLLVYKEGLGVGTEGGAGLEPPLLCGNITGRVFNVQDNAGLSGFTVWFRYRSNQGNAPWSQWMSTTTGPVGTYQFSNLVYNPAQQYEVGFVAPSGWELIQPASNYTFVMNPGVKCYVTGIDFGIRQKSP